MLKFAATFVVLSVAGTLAQRYLGSFGFLTISALGGLVSSARTTATAAALAATGRISPQSAGVAAVLTSMMSVLVDMPIFYRQTHQRVLASRFAGLSALVVAVGLTVMVCTWGFITASIQGLAVRTGHAVHESSNEFHAHQQKKKPLIAKTVRTRLRHELTHT